jgi:hypothetical protein
MGDLTWGAEHPVGGKSQKSGLSEGKIVSGIIML